MSKITHRKRLKKVGTILHKSKIARNVLIAKVYEYLEPGLRVYNTELEAIGVVLETFGPVNEPYCRIKLEDPEISFKAGEHIFIIIGEKTKIKWKKMPKRRGKYARKRRNIRTKDSYHNLQKKK